MYFRSKSEKQERIIQQKNTEIERLKQQQTEHNSKLSELTLVFWVFYLALRSIFLHKEQSLLYLIIF